LKQKPLFTLLEQDANIAAFNKASGLAVLPDRWDAESARLDRLAADFLDCQLWTVHRIDRDTSGLVIFAKTEDAHARLSRAFEQRQISKRYVAIVQGQPSWAEETCGLPLVPNGNKRHLTIIDRFHGKPSKTAFKQVLSVGKYSVIEAAPASGRMHQIRVHLAALGFPVVCDSLYGGRGPIKPVFLSDFKRGWHGDAFEERPLLSRLGLHALSLEIPAGVLGNAPLRLEAPLAKDMAACVNQMRKRLR
jgi:23S rRNA pseudouridine1911/1915/1917 synthase